MEVVELRVHGVHGTSPGTMLGLGDGEVGQVAGDKLTGIYRPKDGVTLPYRSLEGSGVSVEAYSWSALTSGIQGFLGWVRRALWLLLLPFALANLAYWARLELALPTAQARWGARAVRVSGLLLTVFMVLTPSVIAVDLLGWQCYRRGVPGCSRLPDSISFVAGWSTTERLAVTSLVPMLVLLVLWLLSKQSLSRYEDVGGRSDDSGRTGDGSVLRHPQLWAGLERTRRLQRLHLVVGIATVTAFTGGHVVHAAKDAVPLLWVTLSLALLLGAAALVLATVSHADDLEHLPPGERRTEQLAARLGDVVRGWDDVVYRSLVLLALGVYGVQVAVLWFDTVELDESLDFFGHNLWFIGVFVLLTALHLSVFAGGRMRAGYAIGLVIAPVFLGSAIAAVLFARDDFHGTVLAVALGLTLLFWLCLNLWQYRVASRRNHSIAWFGAGASVFLAAASWVALLFTTSAVVAAANYLNGDTNGVSGLVSTIERKQGGAPAATPFEVDKLTSPSYVATGDVLLRRARVIPGDATRPTVVSGGRIEVGGLSLDVPAEESFTEGLGATVVRRSSTITLEGTDVRIADSCIGPGRGACTGEDPDYHASGVLQVGSGSLRLEPGSGEVVIDPAEQPEYPLVVPQVLIWTPIAQLVWVIAVAVALLLAVTRFRRRAVPLIAERTFAADPAVPERDRSSCLKARQSAALAHRAETLLDVVGAVTAPIALVTIVLSMTGEPPWALPHAEWTRSIATASMYLVVGMSAGLVLLGSQIRRSESARKAAGVIWDLTSFWPRAAHPLAPPCYAERVVPELETRTRWALEADPANLVVLSGHSQGSLIVASMASRLSLRELQRVRIITYGSQIRALYGRVFPRVFGPETIGYTPTTSRPRLDTAFPDVPGEAPAPPPPTDPPDPADTSLRGRLSRAGGTWVNLFRRSDYLGYRVFSDRDSVLDRPVPEVPPTSTGDPGPAVLTHSGYQHSLEYRTHVALWTGEELLGDPAGTTNLTVLPPV